MDPWLRALAALPKDLGLIASTYMAANRSQKLQFQEFKHGLLDFKNIAHVVHRLKCKQNAHI